MKKPLVLFGVVSLLLAAAFFFIPINIFDGEIVIKNGLQEMTVPHNLSLSNFIGIGTEGMEEKGIVDFYLTTRGWLMAIIFIFGFPALFAYRMHLRSSKS